MGPGLPDTAFALVVKMMGVFMKGGVQKLIIGFEIFVVEHHLRLYQLVAVDLLIGPAGKTRLKELGSLQSAAEWILPDLDSSYAPERRYTLFNSAIWA